MKLLRIFLPLALLLMAFTGIRNLKKESFEPTKFQIAYTADQETNALIPVDLETGISGLPIQMERHPSAIAISKHSQMAYTLSKGSSEIMAVNLATRELKPSIHLNGSPKDIAMAEDPAQAFVIFNESNRLAKIDIMASDVNWLLDLKSQPSALSVAKNGKIYVSYENSSLISSLNCAICQIEHETHLPLTPKAFVVTSDEKIIYLEDQNILTLHDLKLDQLLKKIEVRTTNTITNLYLSQDEKKIFLTALNSNEILSISLEDETESRLDIPHKIETMALYPKEKLEANFSQIVAPAGTKSRFDASETKPFHGEIVNYSWDFGDGHQISTESPRISHAYSQSDDFDVTLTVREALSDFPLEIFESKTKESLLKGSTSSLIQVPKNHFDKFAGGSESTTTSINSSAEPAVFGESITFTSVVSSADGIPTGTVNFVDSTLGTIGSGTLDGTGTATFITSTLAVGTYSLAADYSGDVNFASSSSSPPQFEQNVNQALTATALTGTPNPSFFGNAVTLTATISVTAPGAGTPTGTVNFFNGATNIGSATVSLGQAIINVSSLTPGLHSLTAVYSGDTDFATSTSSLWTQTVNQGSTSTAVSTSLTPSPFGNSVTFTANVTVTNGTGTPTGTVTFKDGTTTLGTVNLTGTTASFSTSTLAVGTHTITATYNGDTNFVTSLSPNLTEIISQGQTATAVTSSLNPSTYGASVTFTAAVTLTAGAGTPTGNVTFREGATTLGTVSLDGTGHASLALFNLSVGSHTIVATYSGDMNFSGSTSPGFSQTVNTATPTNTLASSLNPSNFGDLVTFTATLTAPTTLGTPTGTVNFFNGSTLIGTGTLAPSGANTAKATFAISTLNAGTLPITAAYSGDSNFAAVTSPVLSQVVNPVSTTTTNVFSNSQNPSTYGEPIILKATVTGSTTSPPVPPTGQITFFDGGTALGTVNVSPVSGNPNSSSASLTVTTFTTGSHVITAKYLGDVNYPASPVSASFTQVVNKSRTTSATTSSANPADFGQNVTFTTTVTPVSPGAGTPTGTVLYYDGSVLLGSGTLVPGTNSSTATFTTNSLSLGSHTISSIYQEDTNFTSSSAPLLTQNIVQQATTTLITGSTSSPAGFNFGDYITFSATVAPVAPGSGTPTGTVNFFDGTTLIATGTLSGGVATGTTFKLYPTPPLHSITAVYSGDTNFTTSTSPVFSQAINNTLPTTTSVTSSRNSSPGGADVTYTASVVANPGTGQGIPGIPAGTVTFTDTTAGVVLGTATLDANGNASITESGANLPFVGPAPDIHEIQATFNGETAFFDPSTNSPLFNQYIVPYNTTNTLTVMPTPTSTQGGSTLTATIAVTNGPPSFPTVGTVTFFEGTTNLGTVAVGADGTATLNPNNLHFGTDTITAIYSGDTTEFAEAFSNPVTLPVQQTDMLTTSTVLTASPTSTIFCQPVTFTATVTATQGFYTPTGTVTFFSDDSAIGNTILNENGVATLTISTLPVGTHTIQASYNSDSNYAFSFSNTTTQIVSPNTTALAISIIPALTSTPYGQHLILSATVTSTTAYTAVPTGTVTFSDATETLATVELDSSGMASFSISTLDVGSYLFTATYNADPCFVDSTNSEAHTINQINPETSFTSTPNPSIYGDTLTLTATVSSAAGTPTGSVTFFEGGVSLGTVFLEGGTASLEITSPPAGLAVLNAQYNGDTNFLPIMTASVLQTIHKAPTATCLVSYTTNPSVFGEVVTFSATVSSDVFDSDTDRVLLQPLTGTVNFYNNDILLATVALNGCNTAEFETNALNLGSGNSITAIYSGDSNFATSTSSELPRTVVQANTSTSVTSVTSTPNPPTFGTLVTFNVAVNALSPGAGTPTGTITGFYGTTNLGTGTLVNGIASFSTAALPAGVQTVVVEYSGDTNFIASQTVSTMTVLQVATTSTLTSSNNPAVFGQPVTFSVTVTSSQGTPSGTISFLDGTTTLGTATLNSSGSASFTTSSLTIGTHPISAVYSGGTNFSPSTTSTITETINKASTTTVLKSTPNPSVYGQTTTLVANVSTTSPGSGIPTGTVTFKNGATTIGSSPLNSVGNASIDISTSLAASLTPYSLTAVYSGDTNFNTSTGPLSQTITKSATNILATYSPNPANIGQAVTLNLTVQPINLGVGIPTGTVTAMYGSQVVATGTLSSNGTVSFSTTSLPAGTLGIVLQYQGDSNFFASSAPITETINQSAPTISLTSSPNPSVVGQAVTFTANVTSTGGSPTGYVTFKNGTTVLGTADLSTGGVASFSTTTLPIGSDSITAVYSGDPEFATATSTPLTQVVNKVPSSGTTTTVLTSIPNPSVFGRNVNFVANVSSPNGTPTGTVTFFDGATALGTVSLFNDLAIFPIDSLSVGPHNITAVYNGDANFNASLPSAIYVHVVDPVTVTITTVTTLTSLNNPSTYGSPVTFNVSVTSAALPPPYPSGFVTLYVGSVPLVTLPLDATGNATYTTSSLPAGNLEIVAFYSGDSTFSASTAVIPQVVLPISTITTLTSSLNPSTFGASVTFTATVASDPTNAIPTGTVSFYADTVLIKTVLLDSFGVANTTISNLEALSHTILAVYNSDPNFLTSSDSLIQVVDPADTTTLLFTSTSNPSNLGESITFIANVSSPNGVPTGPVSFFDGTTLLGTGQLFNGLAFFSTSSLSVGSHSITAVYGGNSDYTASTSTPYIQQVINESTILDPPRGFCGCKTPSKFLNKTYYSIILTWNAPGAGAEPTFYNIYRDPELTDRIATIPACDPLSFIDKKVTKKGIYTYYLVAGNDVGLSSAVSVTVGPGTGNCCSK